MTDRPQRRRLALVITVAAAVVLLDQLSKTWAEHHLADRTIHVVWTLRLKLELNPGIAFSLGQGSTGLVTAAAVVILGLVAVFVWRTSGSALGVAFGLIVGGAVGNLSDRFFRDHAGQVIDFIDLRWWPVFNVADAAITCGVVLAVLLGARTDRGASRLSAQP